MGQRDQGKRQAETALYRSLLDSMPSAIFVSELDSYRLLYANAQAETLMGETAWRGKPCYEMVCRSDAPCVGCNLRELGGEEPSAREIRFPGRDRRYIMRGRILDWNGAAIHVEYVTDETERIQKEESVLERYHAEEMRRASLSADVVAVGSADVTRNMLLYYDGRKTLGKQLHGGLSLEQLGEAIVDGVPDLGEKAQLRGLLNAAAVLAGFRQGETENAVEYRRAMQDGSIRWVRLQYRLVEQPYTGNIMAYIYVRDINEWKLQLEVAAALIERDFDYITCIDGRTGYYTTIPSSRCRVPVPMRRGSDYEKAAIQYFRDHIPEEQWEGALPTLGLEGILHKLDQQGDFHVYHDTRSVDGGYIRQDIHYFFMDRENRRILLSSKDISAQLVERERRNEELSAALLAAEQGSRAKSDFLSRMSHEVRTPMNAIIGLANLGREGCQDLAMAETLQKIEDSAQYLLGILNDVLDMAKIENGKLELHPEPYLLEDFVTCLSTVIMPLMEKKGIDFQVLTDDPTIRCVLLDKLRINQIFFNLLSNAAKFTPEGGRVELELQHSGKRDNHIRKRFIVRDNGTGMRTDFLEHAYEPFVQEQSGRTAETEGTGLGLAITRNLVEMMGGTMEITSRPGEGTVVVVDLEVELAEQPNSGDGIEAVWRESLAGRRVLLAEDHPLNRLVAVRLLERHGLEVFCAENGQEAVDCFAAAPEAWFDVVLMDIRMPVMDGLDAARAIRALNRPDAAEVPIIAMTANAFVEDTYLSREAGMNAHLCKPVDPLQLWGTLAEQLGTRRQA